jgi:hypothetical protein
MQAISLSASRRISSETGGGSTGTFGPKRGNNETNDEQLRKPSGKELFHCQMLVKFVARRPHPVGGLANEEAGKKPKRFLPLAKVRSPLRPMIVTMGNGNNASVHKVAQKALSLEMILHALSS